MTDPESPSISVWEGILLLGLLCIGAFSCTISQSSSSPKDAYPTPAAIDSADGRDTSEATPGDRYVWMDYNRLRQGRTWMRVSGAGVVLRIRFPTSDTSNVASVQTGTLSTARANRFFAYVQQIEFFSLDDASPPSGQPVESDVLTVKARFGDRYHAVSARPPTHVPSSLTALVDSMESFGPMLHKVTDGQGLVRTQPVSPSRAETLRGNGTPQVSLTDLSEYESLRRAVQVPGQYGVISPKAAAFVRNEMLADAPYSYFLISLDQSSTDPSVFALSLYSIGDVE